MHESYNGVMDMACNTLLKIAQTCKEEFVIVHNKPEDFNNLKNYESEPYINELIRKIPDETSMLEPINKLVFYESVGHMISMEFNFEKKQFLLQATLKDFWDIWGKITSEAQQNIGTFRVNIFH